jgi:succinyl-diaminopimelate desuccinylase
MAMNQDKEKLIKWLDDHQEEMIQFLQEIVHIPSDNPKGDCYPIASFIYEKLRQLGFEQLSLLEVDKEEVNEVGMKSIANIVSSTVFGDEEGKRVVLNAHGDVVPPGLGWTFDPYGGEVSEGKIYGRGAAVSKSDIAAYTFSLLALKKIKMKADLNGKIDLAFTFDEETGGELGPKWLLERGYITPDLAIVAGFTHSIVNAHNGCLHLEITITGKSAHAALPNTGTDAIEAAAKILQSLYTYRKILHAKKSLTPGIDYPTLVVGLISGGINTNVVPDFCTLRLDRRLIPEEDVDDVEEEIKKIIYDAADSVDGIKIDINRILYAESFGPVPKESSLIKILSANWKSVMKKEEDPSVHGVPLYADARHFYTKGIPTVMFGAGPRTLEEANGHRADENIRINDLISASKIIACTLYDLLTIKK